jgi:peptidoglycan/LPS O-acetylase OafA/YrhL
MTSLAPEVPKHIPSLDGLRAISIFLVIVGHAVGTQGVPEFRFSLAISHAGDLGVRVFFVISGFVITTMLLRQIDAYGRISLRYFYFRRILRIFPAALAYLALMCACYLAGLIVFQHGDLLHALTYTVNYHYNCSWYINHLWSLSVEEQFYLLWPLLLFFLGPRRGVKACILFLLLAPVARGIQFSLLPVQDKFALADVSRQFQAIGDTVATGCLLSLCYNYLSTSSAYMRILGWRSALVGATAMGIGGGTFFLKPVLFYVVGQSILTLGIVLILDVTIRRSQSGFGRLLSLKPIVFVGVLSYSLYLWQEPFLYFRSKMWSFPTNVLLTVIAALLSYYCIERPFLKKKNALAEGVHDQAPAAAVEYGTS